MTEQKSPSTQRPRRRTGLTITGRDSWRASPLAGTCLLATAAFVAGCGTIIHGASQDVGISSSPTNAQVSVNGASVGTTPLTTSLRRKDHHTVRVELDGYQPYEATFTRSVSGWVWGNIVFGGLIGLAVDAISGGLYKLTPEQLHAQLGRQGVAMVGEGYVYLTVVLEPEAGWKQVGELDRDWMMSGDTGAHRYPAR